MNSLSWFLYFAEAAPRFGNLLVLVGIFILTFYVGRSAVLGVKDFPFEGVASGRVDPKHYLFGVAIALFSASILVPPKNTIYLIAASEASEMVITSDTSKQILSDLQEILQHQLSLLKPKGKE